jgi:hypothetical protein
MSNAPEFVLELTQHWETHIGMDRQGPTRTERYSDKDSGRSSALHQQIAAIATAENIEFSTQETHHSTADVRFRAKHHFDGGYDLLRTLSEVAPFATAAGLGAFLTKLGKLLIEWKALSNGRHIKVKLNQDEIYVNNQADLKKALEALDALQKTQRKATRKSPSPAGQSARRKGSEAPTKTRRR